MCTESHHTKQNCRLLMTDYVWELRILAVEWWDHWWLMTSGI